MHGAEWWHEQSWEQNYYSDMASTRMMTWTIMTAKLLFKHDINKNDDINKLDNKTIKFKHGIWYSPDRQPPALEFLFGTCWKVFLNYHYLERSIFEIIIIKRVLLRSQLLPTCPKENGHRCLKSGWKQVGGTWSAVAAPPTRLPRYNIFIIFLYNTFV